MILVEEDDSDWDLCWTQNTITQDQFSRLKPYQKINHFPGMDSISRKSSFFTYISRMEKVFPADFKIIPKSWASPIDKFELKVFLASKKSRYLIVHSEEDSSVFLTRKTEEIDAKKHFVQEYIRSPYLIDGYKFDLRFYVLITGCDPLSVFIYKEGACRFAKSPYEEPKKSNYKDSYMHFTNIGYHKWSEAYIRNLYLTKESVRQMKTFSAVLGFLQSQDENTDLLVEKIEEAIVKTILPAQPVISRNYSSGQKEDLSNSMCFELLGVDILLDEDLNPFVLDVNQSPSLEPAGSPDWEFKKQLISDCLNTVNLSSDSKEKWTKRDQFLHIQRKFHGLSWKFNEEQKEIIKENIRKKKTEWEDRNCGGFKRIYPKEDSEKYEMFLQGAKGLFEKYTGARRLSKRLSPGRVNSQSVVKLPQRSSEELFSRLSQQPERKIRTKYLPKIVYHNLSSTDFSVSPSRVQKIELHMKSKKGNSGSLLVQKEKKSLPIDVKVIQRSQNSRLNSQL